LLFIAIEVDPVNGGILREVDYLVLWSLMLGPPVNAPFSYYF